MKGSKVTVARWGNLNETIITGHEDGSISIWDPKVHLYRLSYIDFLHLDGRSH